MASRTGPPPIMPLWTPEQVSEMLGVPITTLYAWRSQNKGPRAVRVGKHLRFRPADVDAWLEAHADPIR